MELFYQMPVIHFKVPLLLPLPLPLLLMLISSCNTSTFPRVALGSDGRPPA